MMELDVSIHGQGWDKSMPSLPVQVVRVQGREIALRFLDSCDDFWMHVEEDEYELPFTDSILYDDGDEYTSRPWIETISTLKIKEIIDWNKYHYRY